MYIYIYIYACVGKVCKKRYILERLFKLWNQINKPKSSTVYWKLKNSLIQKVYQENQESIVCNNNTNLNNPKQTVHLPCIFSEW